LCTPAALEIKTKGQRSSSTSMNLKIPVRVQGILPWRTTIAFILELQPSHEICTHTLCNAKTHSVQCTHTPCNATTHSVQCKKHAPCNATTHSVQCTHKPSVQCNYTLRAMQLHTPCNAKHTPCN
ncbi:Uncharacterized protein PODLI_1B036558, partial [Podarcis lilfordi]